MKKKFSKNIQTVIDILQDEVSGDVSAALKKITSDYTMTWVYTGLKRKELFPTTGRNIKKELEEVYPIKGRQYDIKNIAGGENVVMIELVESYPDPKTKKVYRTPMVLVLEIKKWKKLERGDIILTRQFHENISLKFKLKRHIKTAGVH